MPEVELFHRTDYANTLAKQLLRPSALQINVRSGVFLSGIRRVGKTTFLRQDFVPALEALGALVIYVDLWSDRNKSATTLVGEAVRETLRQLETPGTALLNRFKGLNLGAAGFTFGFQVDAVGTAGGTTLAQAFAKLVQVAQTDVVLIVDEVQQALGNEDGNSLLHALKAARDAVNATPNMPGHFLFVGTGSHKSLITDMATRRTAAFSGALATGYEVLGQDFVAWQLARISHFQPDVVLPSLDVAWQGFQVMGNRPEELLKALVDLQEAIPPDTAPNLVFSIICKTLAGTAADVELHVLRDLGPLAEAIFARIAEGGDTGVTGLFSEEALASYAAETGMAVQAPQVQNLADKMIGANLVTRPGHGIYMVADPFLRKMFVQKLRLTAAPQ
jgi:hypothetical protein